MWIVKPARLSRSRGLVIGDDLDVLLRACAQAMADRSPLVISRYILHPALYRNRKFDLRFIVALRSIRPLSLAMYERWVVRCADDEYSTGGFANLRSHLTVMQYLDDADGGEEMKEEPAGGSKNREWVTREQLVGELAVAYGPTCSEQHISAVCGAAILDCFRLATAGLRGAANEIIGIDPNGAHAKTRACYGVDLLLRPSSTGVGLEPVLLEVNYKPDLRRVLHENPEFYNELFPMLFAQEGETTSDIGTAVPPGWRSYVDCSERSEG